MRMTAERDVFFYWNGQNEFGHQLWQFICEGLCLGVHVTSDVIMYHCCSA